MIPLKNLDNLGYYNLEMYAVFLEGFFSINLHKLNENVNAFQRNFVNEVKRCEEMERKLRLIEGEIRKEKEVVQSIHHSLPEYCGGRPPMAIPSFEDLEVKLIRIFVLISFQTHLTNVERELNEVNSNQEALIRNLAEFTEMQYVLQEDSAFFNEVHSSITKFCNPLLGRSCWSQRCWGRSTRCSPCCAIS